ncbi:MAG TPA: fibronectin type III domain-containing protein, partial [Archangium sp.]|nr:fibronectin type III domain-containing protein [Archangium sp.]
RNPDTITFTGRDMGGVLQDVWTAEEKVYGSDSGVPLETVCNAILADAQLSDFALYTPVASTQALGKYKQDFEPAMDALAKLAAGRGWEVRWKLRPDTGTWGLWLWGPDRAATAPVWTYTASDYQYLGELSVGLEDVRTAVEVVYPDASDLDAAGQPKRKTVRRESATALARYGYLTSGGTRLHRLMRVTEGATTNIRSAAEAGRLADAALADLSTTDMGATVEVALHPALELGDLVALTPNGINFSAEQRMAVRQVTHSLTATSGRTVVRLLGKPALGPHVWLSMEGRPGIAPGSPFTGPAAPSGLTVTNSVTGAVLLFTAPNLTSGGPAAEEYELHVGTSPGFSLSSSTLKAVSSSTRFDLTGLAAGVPYYARVRSRDRRGNVGPASEEVTLVPRYLEVQSLEPFVDPAAKPPNGDFQAVNTPSGIPDAWGFAGTWGTDARIDATVSYSGGQCVLFPTIGTALLDMTSQAWTTMGGDIWEVNIIHSQSVLTSTALIVQVEFLGRDFLPVNVSTINIGTVAVQINVFYRTKVDVTAPNAGVGGVAAYMRVKFRRTPPGGDVRVDRIACRWKGSA